MKPLKKNTQKKWRNLGDKYSLSMAILYILLSTFLISGSAGLGIFFYQHLNKQKKKDSKYNIIAIVQSAIGSENIKTAYLSEILDLSIDKPKNLFAFSLQDAEKKLSNFPLIKSASINKLSPGTLFISYTIRSPRAYLGDFSNTAISEDGMLIPFKPFFSPKKLPIIFFGFDIFENKSKIWGTYIDEQRFQVACSILKAFETVPNLHIEHIDLSRMTSESYGKREIIVALSNKLQTNKNLVIRLNAEKYLNSICLFKSLKFLLEEYPKVIDLRLDHLGLIS